jgi:hypothetical protein
MALKFRRGTTAQQSGSLAFGEPYVNTTLGTLLIGGPDGDIALSAAGTGSTGNFGPISGSGLDITGDANIHGNLTLGGNIKIGDSTTDNVSINADLSSSIIPDVTNAFDLGSTNKVYRNVYATSISGAIAATNGVVSGSSQVIGILDSLNTFSGSQLTQNSALATITGSLISSASTAKTTNDSQDVSLTNLNTFSGSTLTRLSALETETSNLESFTSSINTTIKSKLDSDGVISGSSQVTLSSTTGFSAYSTSVDSRIATEKGRVDAILLSADADKDSFAEIVSLINSVDTTNDTAFASFYTASVGRLNNLESTSASVNISVSNLNSFTSSINATIKSKLDADGVISGSSQISLSGFSTTNLSEGSNLYYTDVRVKAKLNAETVVSGSSQVIGILSSLNTYTGSNDTTNTTQNSRLTALEASASTALSTNNTQATSITNLNSTTASLNTSVSNLNTYTGSNNTTNTTQNTRLTALEASASTALSTNNTQGTSITNLNSTTASLNTSVSNLNSFSSSALTRLTDLEGKDFNITLTGDVTGTGTVTNLGNVSFATTIAANSVALGTDTTGNYVASLVAGTNITLSNNSGEGATPTIGLTNNTISGIALGSNLATLTIGTGLSGTSYNGSTGVTIANTGVTSNVAGTGVSVSGATGAVTISIGQAVATSDNVRFNSLGIGMAASATAGRIDATNDIVAFSSSDIRFKENIKPIENAIDKIRKISGNTYDWKEENKIEHGYEGNDVGVIAQEIEAVLPQLVQTRENGYKAVKYDKLVALLIEGIKEQQLQIEQLRIDLDNCRNNKGL